ncbi:exosortase X [Rufibacter psychrotolerans]|uniref:exosortase X n=1 Tax=Rufibacter psychrotolerans TaxID=2812556 RepID=UPI001968951E|nr:archaeosortase/exosortase family protein [Rufibacter sp. SYSU D00308]
MFELYHQQKSLFKFLGTILGLYGIWFLVYECWVGPNDYVDTWLSEQVAQAGAWSLSLLGYSTQAQKIMILVDGRPTVFIGNPCNSLALMATFTGLIGAFPGDLKKKLFFIPVGIVAIYLINVLRVAALSLNHIYSHGTVDFNHKYTFSFVVYAFIFGMWVIWVKKYSSLTFEGQAANSHA